MFIRIEVEETIITIVSEEIVIIASTTQYVVEE